MKLIRDNSQKKVVTNNISKKIGLPINYSSKIVDDLIFIIISNIIIKKKIKVKNFGTFLLKQKNKRVGRNPLSKVNHIISERKVVTFKTSEYLKSKINKNES